MDEITKLIMDNERLIYSIANYFKRKAHQFKHNDKYGRMSFFLFGVGAFAHKQKVIGIMYLLFEIA